MAREHLYTVKEIFRTLQGEGAMTGRTAVFMRFAGCNLWTGREEDRHKAVCKFCDTDFIGTDGERGGKYSAQELANVVEATWLEGIAVDRNRYIVITGGEPTLQLDTALIDALHAKNFEIAIETNGTNPVPEGVDWICVSPKSTATVVQTRGNELKLVYPQAEALPEKFEHMEFDNFFLQPMDSEFQSENTARAIEYCCTHPQWRLSLQTHKLTGIP